MEKLGVSVTSTVCSIQRNSSYAAFISVKGLVLVIASIFPPALCSRAFSLNLCCVSRCQGSFGLLCFFPCCSRIDFLSDGRISLSCPGQAHHLPLLYWYSFFGFLLLLLGEMEN